MADPGPSRTGYNRIDHVLDPQGEGTTQAWVNEADLRHVYKLSRWKFHNLLTAIEVLRKPKQVWVALRQVGEEEALGYAYVGFPQRLRSAEGTPLALGPERAFLVFLDLRMSLIEWRTEVSPPEGFSAGDRFKELLWSR